MWVGAGTRETPIQKAAVAIPGVGPKAISILTTALAARSAGCVRHAHSCGGDLSVLLSQLGCLRRCAENDQGGEQQACEVC